jgi:NAD(P)-dependent dehydrogenase (short-subunit alcohol dehydrogenase family)
MSSSTKPVALVTGASGGIGLAIATKLAAEGYSVVGTSRIPRSDLANGIGYVTLDVADDLSVRAAVAAVIERHGRIDVLVNNAGVGMSGAAEESSRGQVAALFDTNVFGLAEVTNAVLPFMRAQGSGRIVNLSSVFGFNPAPHQAMYAATKHAVEGYSESLDHELRHLGIRVTVVEPGVTASNFDKGSLSADRPLAAYDSARKSAAEVHGKLLQSADAPVVVADVVFKAIRARNPKARYPAGKVAVQLTVARRLLPATAYTNLIRSVNNLPQTKKP